MGSEPEERQGEPLRQRIRTRLRPVERALRSPGHTRPFVLTSILLFAASMVLVQLEFRNQALVPAMLGFGLALTALLYAVFPSFGAWMDSLPRPATVGVWSLLAALLAFVAFSSTVVILLVLLLGGFMMGVVLWRFLGRMFGAAAEPPAEGDEEGQPDLASPAILIIMTLVATGSVIGSFFMGIYRLHEAGPLGLALAFGNGALLLGILPTVAALLGLARTPLASPRLLFRQLLRDLLFGAVLGGLIGYEVALATSGQPSLPFVPTTVLLLIVVLGYLGVLVRFFLHVGKDLQPDNPLLVASFGMLLLLSPTVVLLSSPAATLARVYGAAQASGLLAVLLYLALMGSWEEEFAGLGLRIREALNRGVSFHISINDGPDGRGDQNGGRGRGFFRRRRARREERESEG